MSLDHRVFDFVVDHRVRVLNGLARTTMAMGTRTWVVVVESLVVLVVVARLRLWRAAVLATVAYVVTTVAAATGKAMVHRHRPPHAFALVTAGGSSMPSANTAQAAAVAVVVGILLTRRWPRHRIVIASGCVAAVCWVGFCVVYLGVHWVTDVVAGMALGSLIGAGTVVVADRWWSIPAGSPT